MSWVYEYRCAASGKSYVGKCVTSPAKRWAKHRYAVAHDSMLPFHKALRKHGQQAFERIIHAENVSDAEAMRIECELIRELGTKVPGGYNLTDGGEGVPGWRASEAARANMKAAALRRGSNPISDIGRNPSAETRAKMSAAGKRRAAAHPLVFTDEMRAKISAALSGTRWTEERRRAASLARKGRTHSPETRARMSAAHKHRPTPSDDVA